MKVYLFACIEKNIGDDIFVKLLCERYPHVDFVITSSAQYGSLAKIPNLHFSKNLKRWIWACSLNPSSRVKKIIAKCLKGLCGCFLPRYDVGVSIVGNAFKNISYTGHEQSQWIRDRINLVKRFYLISTNFGPYNDERWKKDFDKIYPLMADVCFRDRYSYDLFKDVPTVRYSPDAVISLGNRERIATEKKNIIISLIDCSFYARSEQLRRAASEYERKMVDIAKKFLSEGYKVTLLNSNTEQDRPACDRILKELDSSRIDIVDYDGNLDTIFDLFKNSSCAVATRLHTIVLAWLYKMPVVPVVYDIKVANLMKLCGFNGKQYDITDMGEVTADEIYKSLKEYDFELSSDVIDDSQRQFEKLDKEFASLEV